MVLGGSQNCEHKVKLEVKIMAKLEDYTFDHGTVENVRYCEDDYEETYDERFGPEERP